MSRCIRLKCDHPERVHIRGGTFTLGLLKLDPYYHDFIVSLPVFCTAFDVSANAEVTLPTLHIHLDESGDLNFSPTGTRYFIFAAAWTYEPAPLANELNTLRFSLIKQGHGERLSGFHAKDDAAPRRATVIPILRKHTNWNFASIVVEKRRVNPTIWDCGKFYPKFSSMALRFVFRGRIKPKTSQVLIYTDTLPFSGKQARAAEAAIKSACRSDLPNGIRFTSFIIGARVMHGFRLPIIVVGAFAESGNRETPTLTTS